MGCAPFANLHFQMGVTVMGFAVDLGLKDLDALKAVCVAIAFSIFLMFSYIFSDPFDSFF